MMRFARTILSRAQARYASPLALAALLLVGCAPAVVGTTARADHAAAHRASVDVGADASAPAAAAAPTVVQRGLASWYGPNFAGRPTANGEIFDPGQLTAAHKTLPFGTRVRVVNLENGRTVVVRINDRGPFKPGRIIDLSRAAAEAIDMLGSGVVEVRLEAVDAPGTVPVHAWSELSGYRAISPDHPAGRLLVLRGLGGEREVLVRVVSSDVPDGAPVGLLLAPDLIALLGDAVLVYAD